MTRGFGADRALDSCISSLARAMTFLGLLGAASSSLATPITLVATDSSWKVTATDPGASGWQSNPGFDDSAWESATELYDVVTTHPLLGAAKGIWTSGGQYSMVETQMWARRTFTLGVPPLSALLNSGFDDDGDLFVNGALVISDHNGFANDSFADITPYLVAGDNLIAFTVMDNFQVWGYNHSAWLQVDGELAAVPEPDSLALLGLGAAVMGMVRRRRIRS